MAKLFNFICLLIVGIFLYQYHIGDITSTDVLRYSMDYETETISREKQIIEKNRLDVVVLRNTIEDLDKYINSVKIDYDGIFLIAENHSWQGRAAIISNNEITDLGIKSSYWAFEKEPQIHEKINLVQNNFPNTDIYPILIKDFVKYEDLKLLAEQITNLNKNILVISIADLSNTYNENLSLFQDEVSLKVIQSSKDFSKINVDSIPVIKLALLLTDELKLYGNEIKELEKPLSILAFGDMMLGRYVRTLMDRNGQDYIFKNIAGEDNEFFKGTDIVFGNLEGPIKGKGRSGGTSMVFTFNEDIADFLKRYNFNLVSIANNHAVDAGWDGRETTIDELNKSGVNWCGHPSEADPYSVFYQDNYAFVCLHDVSFKLNDREAVELIKEVRKKVDHLIVTIHWGNEYQHTANYGKQIEPGRAFVDAGADIVIGHHPHVVQNFEIYNNKLIFYSLGNFVFDQYWSKATQEQLGLGIIMEKDSVKVHLLPMISKMSQPRLMTTEERKEWFEEFINYGDYTETVKNQIRDGYVEVNY